MYADIGYYRIGLVSETRPLTILHADTWRLTMLVQFDDNSQSIENLIDSWIEQECENIDLIQNLTSDFNFLLISGTIAKVNELSLKTKDTDKLHHLLSLTSKVSKWRRHKEFSSVIHHDIAINFIDTVQFSLHNLIHKSCDSAKPEYGYVYFLLNRRLKIIKIGWSISVCSRIGNISTQSGCKLELLGTIKSRSIQMESDFHKKFKRFRHHGEWFRYESDLKTFVENKFQLPQST